MVARKKWTLLNFNIYFTHDISYIASIFFTFKNLCELYAHKNYVTGEIHPNSGKSKFCIQNSEDFDCKVVSLTLVQVNCWAYISLIMSGYIDEGREVSNTGPTVLFSHYKPDKWRLSSDKAEVLWLKLLPVTISSNNIHTLSRDKVMRINKTITKEKMLWSFFKVLQLIL